MDSLLSPCALVGSPALLWNKLLMQSFPQAICRPFYVPTPAMKPRHEARCGTCNSYSAPPLLRFSPNLIIDQDIRDLFYFPEFGAFVPPPSLVVSPAPYGPSHTHGRGSCLT